MNQSDFLPIICNLFKAREKPRVQDADGFGFASHWLKNWRDFLGIKVGVTSHASYLYAEFQSI